MELAEKEKCKEKIFRGAGHGSSQCSRNAVKDGYCKQHHPDNVKARREANEAKWKKEHEMKMKHFRRPALLREALEEISKGELNDPAGYAAMKLEEIYGE